MLDVLLLKRHGASIHNGKGGNGQRDILGKGACQQHGAKDKPGNADDGEYPRLDYRYGVQQGCHGGGGDGCLNQPAVQGEDSRLDAKADKANQISDAQVGGGIPHGHVLQAAVDKLCRAAVVDDIDHADKHQGRAADGIVQILKPGAHIADAAAMHNQRQGNQRQQFIEQVQGNQVGSAGDTQGDAVAQQIEGKEGILVGVLFHVFQGIQCGKGPQNRDDTGEYPPRAVQLKGDGQRFGNQKQGLPFQSAQDNLGQGQRRGYQHRQHDVRAPQPLLPEAEEGQGGAQRHGQENGYNQHMSSD